MKRNDAESIGQLVRSYLRMRGLETPLNEHRLVNAWWEVMGPRVASYTSNLFVRNQVLYVHLTSAVLRQELSMQAGRLVDALNRHVGASVITRIVLR